MKININWKKYKILKEIYLWKTNFIALSQDEIWDLFIIKKTKDKNISLKREIIFYWFTSKNHFKIFPKILDFSKDNNVIILEYKNWQNSQEINIPYNNWYDLWISFWNILKRIHKIKVNLNKIEKQDSINSIIDYFNINESHLTFFQEVFVQEKRELKNMISESKEDFVIIHWDFSPHNCLFLKKPKSKYFIESILDPSLRISYWTIYFDIVYLFNTRHNKNKEKLKKWFLENYNININSELFKKFDKVMKIYLIELYNLMNLKEDSNNILKEYKKIYKKSI